MGEIPANSSESPDAAEAYDRATVFAEPELASETPEGFSTTTI